MLYYLFKIFSDNKGGSKMEKYFLKSGITFSSLREEKEFFSEEKNGMIAFPGEGINAEGKITTDIVDGNVQQINISFTVKKEMTGRFFLDLELPSYREEWFVMIPSACYDGNRFAFLKQEHMQLFMEDHIPEDPLHPELVMLEVPSLNNGFNREITDGSAPVIGIWKRNEKEAVFFSFEQGTSLGNNGVEMCVTEEKKLRIRLSIPSLRRKKFAKCVNLDELVSIPAGSIIENTFQCRSFPVEDFAGFYKGFALIRNKFPQQQEYKNTRSFSHASEILLEYFDRSRWNEEWGFYGKSKNGVNRVDLGWVSFVELPALLAAGGEKTRERVKRELKVFFENVPLKSGLFMPAMVAKEGKLFLEPSFAAMRKNFPRPWGFIRHQAEMLLTCLKCFMLLEERGEKIPENWKNRLLKLAETLQDIWKKYGQLGFMIDLEKNEILIGNSDNGCSVPGALAAAAEYFRREDFFDTSVEQGRYYAQRLKKYGFTFGGPGDSLLAPDSESAFAMLESFVLLYEATGEKEFLESAEFAADYCSSWTPAIAWKFPDNSLFDRIGIDCRGAVQANLQNQHGAPGCCTLSASALMRLYCYTGEERFIRLLQEIAHNCVQYISTKAHPYSSRDGKRTLEAGEVCEKVYFQDYTLQRGENPSASGGWTESSLLLTLTEDPGVFWDVEKEKLFLLDHVEGEVKGKTLFLRNPLSCKVALQCFIWEKKKENVPSLQQGLFPAKAYKKIFLEAGEEKLFTPDSFL